MKLTRSRTALVVATLVVVGLLVSLIQPKFLRGNLLDEEIAFNLKALADTNQDSILTTKEIRRAVILVIRGVILRDAGFDVNDDGVVNRMDISKAIQAFRALLSAVCGNGSLQAGEQCDDGNGTNGDGCSATCTQESGFECTGDPSVCTSVMSCGDGTFLPKVDYPVGYNPIALALGDVNRDGISDVVALNIYNTISTLLGNNDGTFLPKNHLQNYKQSVSFALEDVNGDSIPDLITGNTTQQTLSVLLGHGDGAYGAETIYGQMGSGGPIHIAVGDLNADGKRDIAVSSFDKQYLILLRGNGDGTFTPTPYLSGVVKNGGFITMADLNKDGAPDLLVSGRKSVPIQGGSSEKDGVLVFINDRNGAFEPSVLYPTESGPPSSIDTADLNNDGDLDVVTSNFYGHTFSVLLGEGNGVLQAPQNYPSARYPQSVLVADVDADDRIDLLIASEDSNTVSIFPGLGDGTFGASRDYGTGLAPKFIVAADLNRDHALDVLAANYNAGTVSVLLGGTKAIPSCAE